MPDGVPRPPAPTSAAAAAENMAFARAGMAEAGWQAARAAYAWGEGPAGAAEWLRAAKLESKAAIEALVRASADLAALKRALEAGISAGRRTP